MSNKKTLLIMIATLIFSTCSILYSLATSYFISLLYGNTVTIYSLTVGSYMLFLGIGAMLYDKLNSKYGIEMLLYTEFLLVITAYFTPLIISVISALEISFDIKLYSSFLLLGLIGILSGIELPLLMGLEKNKIAGVIGVDYFGGLIGSILYVFFFLPNINTVAIFHYIAFLNLVTAILFYCSYKKVINKKINYKMIIFMIVGGILLGAFSNKVIKKSEYYFINKRLQLKVYLDFKQYKNTESPKEVKKPNIKINKRVVTPYQEIIDANITLFGKDGGIKFTHKSRCILINRMYQFCSDWYYEYHFFEYLVPTLFFPKTKPLNVLIIGGGDLIGTSMLLKYANIKHIDLIDIDKDMIKLAKSSFKEFDFIKGPFYKNKKLNIIIGDAFVVVNSLIKKGVKYDLIIYDLPVVNNHKLLPLMSIEFFKRIKTLLKNNGYFSIYQEIGGTGMEPIKKESILIGCAGFKKVLFIKGFKIKPSLYISYEDNFLYFTNNGDYKIRNEQLLKKMLLNDNYLLKEFYKSGVEYDLKCPKNIKLNSIFKPDFSIIQANEKKY